ncbi:MAG: sigma-70 family RNA polymerase sigma factor [Lachnospiraceae bacterium]|nr:sigma-70 family RNA polymerase sigma factor [Lachnospiraceae bacterium]
MNDEEIVDIFLNRDPAAIRETDEKYGKELYRMAMMILKSHEDAEECRSDTYWKAWQTIPPKKPVSLIAYLAKICRFQAFGKLDMRNAKKRKAEVVTLSAELENCIRKPWDGCGMEDWELGELLNQFLDTLSERSCRFFLRRYWYADSVGETARRYGVGENLVKMDLLRSRNKLKAFLEKEGIDV